MENSILENPTPVNHEPSPALLVYLPRFSNIVQRPRSNLVVVDYYGSIKSITKPHYMQVSMEVFGAI
jgi:hypothetical protein